MPLDLGRHQPPERSPPPNLFPDGSRRDVEDRKVGAQQASAAGLGPRWDALREPWLAEMREILGEAGLVMPKDAAFRSSGKRGVHSEHMGYILSEMQYLQRAYPGGVW